MPVSSVPNFCPDTGGQRWSLFQVASSVVLRGGTSAAFPVYTAQAPGCSIWSAVPALRWNRSHLEKHGVSCACVCAFPGPSNSGSQELHGRTLPGRAFSPPRSQPQFPPAPVGCGVPFRLRVPSPSPCPLWLGACTLCLAMTLPADVMLSCSFCLFCSFVCTGLSLGLWDLFP